VVESLLTGEELPVLAITNGRELVLLPPAQDHKRLQDGDRGPNTGGMGAYSPVSLATPELMERVEREVLSPALSELARRNSTFTGVLYAGLMVDPAGAPVVIEFNCRLGDPEAQAVLPRVTSGLLAAFGAAASGSPLPALEVSETSAVTTVLAAAGYPDSPRSGDVIRLPADMPADTIVFQAGTRLDERGKLRTNGGRVLGVTGIGKTFDAARAASLAGARAISFEGMQYRRDIGWREARRRANSE